MNDSGDGKRHKRLLVPETTERLRQLILSREPETQIGSLTEVAQMLGVGIVTVQQAARVLEHEGLLAVRRGPGGGYYGIRPDEAALQRALAAYMRVHGFGYREALDMLSLMDCEIMPAAAHCQDEELRKAMRALSKRVDRCETTEQRMALEKELRDLLHRMVSRPLVQFLTGVTGNLFKHDRKELVFLGDEGVAVWKSGKRRILQAILDGDEALARFEAERFRKEVLRRLGDDPR
jgi:GntR family transcriptional repressor for pyruvate dehydrogenase complex